MTVIKGPNICHFSEQDEQYTALQYNFIFIVFKTKINYRIYLISYIHLKFYHIKRPVLLLEIGQISAEDKEMYRIL